MLQHRLHPTTSRGRWCCRCCCCCCCHARRCCSGPPAETRYRDQRGGWTPPLSSLPSHLYNNLLGSWVLSPLSSPHRSRTRSAVLHPGAWFFFWHMRGRAGVGSCDRSYWLRASVLPCLQRWCCIRSDSTFCKATENRRRGRAISVPSARYRDSTEYTPELCCTRLVARYMYIYACVVLVVYLKYCIGCNLTLSCEIFHTPCVDLFYGRTMIIAVSIFFMRRKKQIRLRSLCNPPASFAPLSTFLLSSYWSRTIYTITSFSRRRFQFLQPNSLPFSASPL